MKAFIFLSVFTIFGSTFAKPLNLDNGNCPSPSLLSFNKKFCDYFVDDFNDFINAEGYCTNLSGHLISFHSIFDNMDITDKAKKLFPNSNEFATGGNKLTDPSNWTWIDDGSLISGFSDWAPGEPVGSPERNCLHVDLGRGLWYAADCFAKVPFVCRVPAPTPPSTPTTTTTSTTTPAPTTTTSTTQAATTTTTTTTSTAAPTTTTSTTQAATTTTATITSTAAPTTTTSTTTAVPTTTTSTTTQAPIISTSTTTAVPTTPIWTTQAPITTATTTTVSPTTQQATTTPITVTAPIPATVLSKIRRQKMIQQKWKIPSSQQ